MKIIEIFDFIKAVTDLKFEMRYSSIDTDRKDSSAAHSWRLSLMVFLLAEELNLKMDILKAVKIAIIHDIPEVLAGDVDYSLILNGVCKKSDKEIDENNAMKKLYSYLLEKQEQEIYNLWREYEEKKTIESRFVKVLDKIETSLQSIDIKGENWSSHDAVGLYGNSLFKENKEFKKLIDFIKTELKQEFKRAGIPWKKEYDVSYDDE